MSENAVAGGENVTSNESVSPVAVKAKKPAPMKVRNFIDGFQLRKDISFSLIDLSNAQMEQASLFSHYASLHAQSERQVNDFKLVLESAESRVYRLARDEAVRNSEKVTEAQLEKIVAVHPHVQQIKRALNEAKQIETIAKGAVEAFRHRRDMLVQQGANERQERQGELKTRVADHLRQTREEALLRTMRRSDSEEN